MHPRNKTTILIATTDDWQSDGVGMCEGGISSVHLKGDESSQMYRITPSFDVMKFCSSHNGRRQAGKSSTLRCVLNQIQMQADRVGGQAKLTGVTQVPQMDRLQFAFPLAFTTKQKENRSQKQPLYHTSPRSTFEPDHGS